MGKWYYLGHSFTLSTHGSIAFVNVIIHLVNYSYYSSLISLYCILCNSLVSVRKSLTERRYILIQRKLELLGYKRYSKSFSEILF